MFLQLHSLGVYILVRVLMNELLEVAFLRSHISMKRYLPFVGKHLMAELFKLIPHFVISYNHQLQDGPKRRQGGPESAS